MNISTARFAASRQVLQMFSTAGSTGDVQDRDSTILTIDLAFELSSLLSSKIPARPSSPSQLESEPFDLEVESVLKDSDILVLSLESSSNSQTGLLEKVC